MKNLILLYSLALFQFTNCEKKNFKMETVDVKTLNREITKNLEELKIFDGGGPDYAPFILLKINHQNATKYLYDENFNLKDSIIVTGIDYGKYADIFNNVPKEFKKKSGGNFSSPIDNFGFIFEMKFSDSSTNRWGIFTEDYKYSEEIKNFSDKVQAIIPKN